MAVDFLEFDDFTEEIEDRGIGIWGDGPSFEAGGIEEEGLVGNGFEDGLFMGFGDGALIADQLLPGQGRPQWRIDARYRTKVTNLQICHAHDLPDFGKVYKIPRFLPYALCQGFETCPIAQLGQ